MQTVVDDPRARALFWCLVTDRNSAKYGIRILRYKKMKGLKKMMSYYPIQRKAKKRR